MGDALPVVAGVALAVAHLPAAGDGSPAAGEWHHVAATAEGSVTIVVGRVVVGAARAAPADVSQRLRRAVAEGGPGSAAAVLAGLDRAARNIPGAAGSAALCVTLGPSGAVGWSAAGYAPPLSVGPDGARHLGGAPGEPLGLPGGPSFAHGEEELAAGTTLVVGSTGAVAGGPDPVAAVAAGHHDLPPDALAAALTEEAGGTSPPGPGRTLVLARVLPAPLGQRLPADPRRLAALRRTVAAWSEQAALSEDATADLQLLLCEAATNAVEHAYRDTEAGDFAYSVRRLPDAGIRVSVEDSGRWRPPPDDPGYRGRGLAVIRRLATEISLDFSDRGTRIAFTVPGHVLPLDDEPPAAAAPGLTGPGGRAAEGSR